MKYKFFINYLFIFIYLLLILMHSDTTYILVYSFKSDIISINLKRSEGNDDFKKNHEAKFLNYSIN